MTKEGVSSVRAWGKNKSNRRRRKRKDELLGTIHCLWRGGKYLGGGSRGFQGETLGISRRQQSIKQGL